MFTFIHAADIHLDSPLCKLERYEGAPVEAIRGATRRALENLIALALESEVDLLLISGDLYDGSWKDYNTGLYFVSQMARLREAGIPVYLIAGNHDAVSRMTKSLPLPDNVFVFPTDRPGTAEIKKQGIAIHGQGFSAPAIKQNLAVNYPQAVEGYFNIGLLHTGANGRENHEPYAPCSINDLIEKQYNYWALGHIHQHEIISTQPFIVFSGNIQGRHIRETGTKGAVLVKVNEQHQIETAFHPLDVVRWSHIKLDITAMEHGHEVVEAAAEKLSAGIEESDGRSLAVRVSLTGESTAHESLTASPSKWIGHIRAAALDIGAGQIWIEKIQLNSSRHKSLPGTYPAGPLNEITESLNEIRSQPELQENLYRIVEDLKKKLPLELKENSDILCFNDPQWFPQVLDQVQDLLIHRLTHKGSSS